MTELLHRELTHYLRGISYQIHNELKGGLPEADYENVFCGQLGKDGVWFRRQPVYQVPYKGKQMGEYRPDLMLAEGKVVLDFKAVLKILPLHKAQVLSYTVVTAAELGLIFNFGGAKMEFARLPNFLHNRPPRPTGVAPPPDILYPELTNTVLDALHEVHYVLGPGFLHQVYRRAARHEFYLRGLSVEFIKELPLRYQGEIVRMTETRLLYIEQRLLVAAFALAQVTPQHTERIRYAMREMGCQLGLLANFYGGAVDARFLRA